MLLLLLVPHTCSQKAFQSPVQHIFPRWQVIMNEQLELVDIASFIHYHSRATKFCWCKYVHSWCVHSIIKYSIGIAVASSSISLQSCLKLFQDMSALSVALVRMQKVDLDIIFAFALNVRYNCVESIAWAIVWVYMILYKQSIPHDSTDWLSKINKCQAHTSCDCASNDTIVEIQQYWSVSIKVCINITKGKHLKLEGLYSPAANSNTTMQSTGPHTYRTTTTATDAVMTAIILLEDHTDCINEIDKCFHLLIFCVHWWRRRRWWWQCQCGIMFDWRVEMPDMHCIVW